MSDEVVTITMIGGPTALLEMGGLRLLTDPTFSPPGAFQSGAITLTKLVGPAIAMDALGPVDTVLLSHDQHADNLDDAGRALLGHVRQVITTTAGAERLNAAAGAQGGHIQGIQGIQGLAPWQSMVVPTPDGRTLRVIATPARHGPAGIEPLAGDVIGFVLALDTAPDHAVYITGDTMWYDGVAEVAKRFPATLVLVFAGAAQTRGPFYLTMNTNDVIETAAAFPHAAIVPLHHQGWAHFTQSQDDLVKAFSAVGARDRLRLLEPGVATSLKI